MKGAGEAKITLLEDPLIQARQLCNEEPGARQSRIESEVNSQQEGIDSSPLLLTPPVQVTRRSRRARAPPKKLTYDDDGRQTVYEVDPVAEEQAKVSKVSTEVKDKWQQTVSLPSEQHKFSEQLQSAYPSNLPAQVYGLDVNRELWMQDQYWKTWSTSLQSIIRQHQNMQNQLDNLCTMMHYRPSVLVNQQDQVQYEQYGSYNHIPETAREYATCGYKNEPETAREYATCGYKNEPEYYRN